MLDHSGLAPELLLLTGDIADIGEASAYAELRELVDASARGAEILYLPGNHDDRATFRSALLDLPPSSRPLNQVRRVGGLRVIALDSSVPSDDAGDLDDKTLAFLRSELREPAPDGSILALHHPPVRSPIEPMSAIALRRPERLASAIAGSDVRLVCCGHNHHGASAMLAGIPVWVSPATAYRADVTSRSTFRGEPGGGFSVVELTDQGPLVTVVPVPPG